MTFLGADLSLSRSGLVAINAKGAIVGRISIASEKRAGARLSEIARRVVLFTKEHRPKEMAFEATFSGSNRSVGLKLAQLHGAVLAAFADERLGHPVYVSPATLKLFTTGNGHAEKSDIRLQAYKKWGVELDDNDQADAHSLARIAGAIHGTIPTGTAYEHECLKVIGKSPLNADREIGA